jgi:arylsulfatase A-like enzyme
VLHSIHAEELGEHGYYGHYDIYNTELRGALIVSDPRIHEPAARAAQLVSGLDLAPTILDLAGIPVFHDAMGRSFAGALSDPAAKTNDFVFSERIPLFERVLNDLPSAAPNFKAEVLNEFPDKKSRIRDMGLKVLWDFKAALNRRIGDVNELRQGDVSFQDADWKLIHRGTRGALSKVSWWGFVSGKYPTIPEYELYHLSQDPLELHNALEENSELAASMKSRLSKFEEVLQRKRTERESRLGPPRQIILYP